MTGGGLSLTSPRMPERRRRWSDELRGGEQYVLHSLLWDLDGQSDDDRDRGTHAPGLGHPAPRCTLALNSTLKALLAQMPWTLATPAPTISWIRIDPRR